MQAVFQNVLEMSLTASLIALAVMAIRLLFRNAPKWTVCLLWGLVALRLICPVSVETSVSLIPARVASGQLVTNFAAAPIWELPEDYVNSTPENWAEPIPSIGESNLYEVPAQVTPTVGEAVFPILSWGWFAGMVGMLTYAGISYLTLKGKLAEATRLRENIWQCARVDTPFVLGFLRPRIYLPYHVREGDMSPVIAHERAHIQRRDHWWKPLGFLLLCIHWFNPVLWIAYILLCRDIESACDEKVIRHMEKAEKQAYSTALLHCSISRRTIAACPLAFGEVGVKERVKNVMHFKKPGVWVVGIALMVCLVAAVCFLTNPRVEPAAPEPFSHSYRVSNILYQDGRYSFGYTTQTTPRYSLTSDDQLFTIEEPSSGEWKQLPGVFREVKLSGLVFDDYFKGNDPSSEWGTPRDGAESIREQTKAAWRFDVEGDENGVFYYLILTETDKVFLCYGYDVGDLHAEAEPGSLIRWVFQLERTDLLTCNAVSGNRDAYVEPAYYPNGYDWNYDNVSEGTIHDSGTLILSADWNPEILTVREEYYGTDGDHTITQSATYRIPRNRNGKYELPVSSREDAREEAVYFVECDTGVYIFRIVYSNSAGAATGEDRALTLDVVRSLSQKSYDLTWDDFRDYACEDIGSGLFVYSFPIDDLFSLEVIGGDPRMEQPMGFHLRAHDGSDAFIDIREDDVDEFIREHSSQTQHWNGELIFDTYYVSRECLYMNPLSSYYALGGDSGCRYLVTEDAFTTVWRNQHNFVSVTNPDLENPGEGANNIISVTKWEWRDFPFTDEAWANLYFPGIHRVEQISKYYDQMGYQPLTAGKFLLKMDDELWLVEVNSSPQTGPYLWSIYSLVPESVMGEARWEYAPEISDHSPYFRFEFDMEYEELTATCVDSPLMDREAPGFPFGPSLTLPSGNALYWSPVDKDGNLVTSAIIHFTLSNGNPSYGGTIYIDSSDGKTYTATIVGTGLHLSQNMEQEGGVISVRASSD